MKQKEGEGKGMGFGVGFGNVNREEVGWLQATVNGKYFGLYESNGK